MAEPALDDTLRRTPLHELHRSLGARLVPFAGYEMPVQYPRGIIAEHQHTRAAAGLFDVSHMGQAMIEGAGVRALMERLTPTDLAGLKPGQMRYSLLLTEAGGIIDDLMVTRPDEGDDRLWIVVNASRKAIDFAHIGAGLGGRATVRPAEDRALLALQGPQAAEVLARFIPDIAGMGFMTARWLIAGGLDLVVSRSGYTGEDGFEIAVPADAAHEFTERLLREPEVEPIGLGARDSLRLEAGLCLYGHDIDETTSPVEAGLNFAIQKRRREEGGFPGADRILRELCEGPRRLRVGLLPEGRAPAREGTDIVGPGERVVGRVTSGGFGPTVGRPIAMGYVEAAFAAPGTALDLVVRGAPRPARVVALPFVPHRYHRAKA